jgi:hypothetical protein
MSKKSRDLASAAMALLSERFPRCFRLGASHAAAVNCFDLFAKEEFRDLAQPHTLCVPRVVPNFGGNQNTGVCISTFGKCNWSCEESAHVPEPNSGTFFDSIRRLYCRVRFRGSRFILARLTMCS